MSAITPIAAVEAKVQQRRKVLFASLVFRSHSVQDRQHLSLEMESCNIPTSMRRALQSGLASATRFGSGSGGLDGVLTSSARPWAELGLPQHPPRACRSQFLLIRLPGRLNGLPGCAGVS